MPVSNVLNKTARTNSGEYFTSSSMTREVNSAVVVNPELLLENLQHFPLGLDTKSSVRDTTL